MTKSLRICVFCGASDGGDPIFLQAAQQLADELNKQSWGLIYGGGQRGIMGILASSVVRQAGPAAVNGIIPKALLDSGDLRDYRLPPVEQYGHTTVVSTMHERKLLMAEQADAFIALPGGFGTLEELFEIITWNQLGIHHKPIVIFNVGGFFDLLLEFILSATNRGLIPHSHSKIVVAATTAQGVIECINAYKPASGRYLLDWSRL